MGGPAPCRDPVGRSRTIRPVRVGASHTQRVDESELEDAVHHVEPRGLAIFLDRGRPKLFFQISRIRIVPGQRVQVASEHGVRRTALGLPLLEQSPQRFDLAQAGVVVGRDEVSTKQCDFGTSRAICVLERERGLDQSVPETFVVNEGGAERRPTDHGEMKAAPAGPRGSVREERVTLVERHAHRGRHRGELGVAPVHSFLDDEQIRPLCLVDGQQRAQSGLSPEQCVGAHDFHRAPLLLFSPPPFRSSKPSVARAARRCSAVGPSWPLATRPRLRPLSNERICSVVGRRAPHTRMDEHAKDREESWIWGWDRSPFIVSVWAESSGQAWIWRRKPQREGGALSLETTRFRPWLLLAHAEDLAHLGARLRPRGAGPPEPIEPRSARASATATATIEELRGGGPDTLRWLVRADDDRWLTQQVVRGASVRLGKQLRGLHELPSDSVLHLPPEEQYLVASGRTYFRGLAFDDLRRMQIDLETTGLDPAVDRVFLIALGLPSGAAETIEIDGDFDDDQAEQRLLERLVERVAELDPDVIENHNWLGFDLPFLEERARRLGVALALGRPVPSGGLVRQRPSARGRSRGSDGRARRTRGTVPGRELIDTLDAVLRYDFASRDLPSHGLKDVARHFRVAADDRELIPGARIGETFRRDPERVRRYARQDVGEAAAVARLLGGAAFALAKMVPRRYERLSDAGPATGVIDPLLVRAYLRERQALPVHAPGDGTPHNGAALHLFASGVAQRIVKADVASLYPSLMRHHRIGPARDTLGVLLALVNHLVVLRLAAKDRAKQAAPGSPERHTDEALSAAMKLLVNSAYGYLGAAGLTRFSDVHAANEVTRRGRALLGFLCRALASHGVTLLEADTDGVYFSVPASFAIEDENRVVRAVAALLPPLVRLEHDGRYAAMLSHEPKNYALLSYPTASASSGGASVGDLLLRGVAFRSSRSEPYGESFLRAAIERLLVGDLLGVRRVFVATVRALRTRSLPTFEVTAKVRLTKSAEEYTRSLPRRRELPYEAMLASGRLLWNVGERVRVYRGARGRACLFDESEEATSPENAVDLRDYDVPYYERLLRETFAARLARGVSPHAFALLTADPSQPSLFDGDLANETPRLTLLLDPLGEDFALSVAGEHDAEQAKGRRRADEDEDEDEHLAHRPPRAPPDDSPF
jgi:DNA polymerase, archaea type